MHDVTVSGDVDSMLRSANDAAIRSAIGVGTTDAPTFLAQTLTGQSLTGTQDTSLVNLAATWNTSGTPTAIKLNVVETGINSNAASKLLDLQVSGVSKASISKSGVVTTWGGTYNTPSFMLGSLGGVATNGSNIYLFNTATSYAIGLSSAGALMFGVDADTLLYRDATGILAQRNLGFTQAFRLYNATGATPLTDWDRASLSFTNGNFRIAAENSGTTGYNTARGIDFVTGGAIRMSIAGTGLTTIDGIAVSRGAGTNTLNIAIGSGLANNTTGQYNSSVGVNALLNNTSGNQNSAIGLNSLSGNTTGSNNSALGVNALGNNTTGSNSSALGGNALGSNTTGGNNSAFGYLSLQNTTTGQFNSALGVNALQNNTTGGSNSAVGVYALQNTATGQYNSALGANALLGNASGSQNSAIGYQAGRYIADGTTANAAGANSIYLGADTKALANGQTNQVVIGFGVIGLGSHSTTINNTSTVLTKIQGTSAHVLDVTGTIKLSPPASVTPANNGELMVEATSNTTLTFKFKGSDGTVRSGTVTLA